MAPDEYRNLKQTFDDDVAFQGLLREERVADYFRSRGHKVLSAGDEQTRAVFGIPKGRRAADIVVQLSPHRAIVAEVKGRNGVDDALHQLEATLQPVRARFPIVESKVFTAIRPPLGDTFSLRGGTFSPLGYRAVRVFHSGFPGEWPLFRIKSDGSTEVVRLGTEVVCVIFGLQ
jgi:hypothetical protein